MTRQTAPLLQSAWSMALSAMSVECERFYFFILFKVKYTSSYYTWLPIIYIVEILHYVIVYASLRLV